VFFVQLRIAANSEAGISELKKAGFPVVNFANGTSSIAI
jgi:hypothetical protein